MQDVPATHRSSNRSGARPNTALAIALVTIGSAVTFVAIFGMPGTAPEAAVKCAGAGAAGVSCLIEHRKGGGALNVCWSLTFACANGAHATASKCGSVQPGATSQVLMPAASFGSAFTDCDVVSSSAVSGMTVSKM